MSYLKPQSPIMDKDGDFLYPLTTVDQVIMEDGTRLDANLENLGATLSEHFVEENMILSSRQYGNILPSNGTSGRAFFVPDDTLDRVYPVGAIYLSVDATSPANLFGGTWEQIAQGRTLFGADGSNYVAGNTIEAGLPNVSGTVGRAYSEYNKGNASYAQHVSAPFYYDVNEEYGTSGNVVEGSNDAIRKTYMDLSRANAIYGNSDTVQPPAYVVYMWKRVA